MIRPRESKSAPVGVVTKVLHILETLHDAPSGLQLKDVAMQTGVARVANTAQSLPKGPQEAVKAMASDMKPTLAYAYAQGDSITFAANTEGGPFGLSPATLLGMPNALEMQSIIQHGMEGKGK